LLSLFSNLYTKKKETLLIKLCDHYNLNEENIAYIGDDVNDLEIMKKIGFSVTPKDGNIEVKKLWNNEYYMSARSVFLKEKKIIPNLLYVICVEMIHTIQIYLELVIHLVSQVTKMFKYQINKFYGRIVR
jgi:hypothetical protein